MREWERGATGKKRIRDISTNQLHEPYLDIDSKKQTNFNMFNTIRKLKHCIFDNIKEL